MTAPNLPRRLGRRPQVPGRKSVPFGPFVRAAPVVPLVDEPVDGWNFGMDFNDVAGDCVVAGFDHARQVITGLLTGVQQVMTPAQVIADYRTQNPGYDPGLPADDPAQEDNGMVIQLFLEYLVKQGRILAFGRIDQANPAEFRAATYLGLAVIIGVDLRLPQQNQTVWDEADGGDWGGHCVPSVGYRGDRQRVTCVTWGALLDMTERFIRFRCDEAWFILLPEHVAHPGFRAGYDLPGFAAAVKEMTGGKVIVPTDPPPAPAPAPLPGPPPFSRLWRWLLVRLRRLLGLG